MFDNLSENLSNVFGKLRGKGVLKEEDVDLAMREVRTALLEADVALPVVKDFIANVKEKAIGQDIVKSVSPDQMVIKIVNDELTEFLGGEGQELNLRATPPVVIMMAGLQGSGKTTTTAKIANLLKTKQNKKILMASLDVYRPAAQEQLATLGKQVSLDTLPIVENEKPLAITKRAISEAKKGGYDVLFLDTAGRLHIDDELMDELSQVHKLAKPTETLLVADSLTGQDAVNVAEQFNEKIGVTGIVLTRIDGDGRGGAALSMKHVTGCQIKYLGTGEKISELEAFHPSRIAQRILGMGDIATLVEKAEETVKEQDAKRMAKKMRKGTFDFNDLNEQFDNIKKMGGMGSLIGMMPGLSQMKKQVDNAGVEEKVIVKYQSIICSMTKAEREEPKLINPSRKKRIAAGAGVSIQEVNQLIKQFKQMQLMMKKVSKMGKKGLMRQMGSAMNQPMLGGDHRQLDPTKIRR